MDKETQEFIARHFDLTNSELAILLSQGRIEHGLSTIIIRYDSIGPVVEEYVNDRLFQSLEF